MREDNRTTEPTLYSSIGNGLVDDGKRMLRILASFAVVGAGFKRFGGEGTLVVAGVGAVAGTLLLRLLHVAIRD